MKKYISNSVINKIGKFLDLFLEEINYYRKNVINEDTLEFLKYYTNFLNYSIDKLKFFLNKYVRRVYPIINLISNFKNGNPKILDAGCGYGTESLLFACFGAEVMGFALRTERIEFAKKR
jgi:2-polyprenyl-3-methyl-5-hydroxy-6-metoxy-1,4-benzoquinol methylase